MHPARRQGAGSVRSHIFSQGISSDEKERGHGKHGMAMETLMGDGAIIMHGDGGGDVHGGRGDGDECPQRWRC